ncbi:metal ABC transporter metal-binding protein [Bacillus sp. TS-2]|nr:metal ABC transporter metal-binding protein [Bacillus sp. TS-2]
MKKKIVKMKPNDELVYYDENLSSSTVEIKDIWKWISIGEYFVKLDVKRFTSNHELLELYGD